VVLGKVDDAGRFGFVETDSRGISSRFARKSRQVPRADQRRGLRAGARGNRTSARRRSRVLREGRHPGPASAGSIVCGFPTDGRFIDIGVPSRIMPRPTT
jgi:hypothetical protein